MTFIDEFHSEPAILRSALEAAVGPLPAAEEIPTGWIRVEGHPRLFALSPENALTTARAALAVYLAARERLAPLEASAAADRAKLAGRVLIEDAEVEVTAEGIMVTGRIPSDVIFDAGGMKAYSLHAPRRYCGDIDPEEGACLLEPDHAGGHFHTMGKLP